jgi:hypothetical protein
VVDQEEEKERARLHNLEAAREAEARKERKRRAAERKAEQKARANKVKEAHKAAGTTKDSDGKAKQCVSATEQVHIMALLNQFACCWAARLCLAYCVGT